MNSEAILAIGGVVGSASKILMIMMRVTGRTATLAAVAVTLLAFTVWGISHDDFTRASSWGYFLAFWEVLGIAAGTFHITEEVTKKIQGTGDGR